VLKVLKVKSFGQMPQKIIYREIEELTGITLEEYLMTILQIN